MLDPIKAWHEEHTYFRRLLKLLQHEMDAFACGDTPNFQLMRDIIAYLRDWADEYHHPREDEAFRRIARLRPERELAIARLKQEHRVIARAGEQLEKILEEVEAGDIVPRAQVEIAAATFLVYYGNHISQEEEDILPIAATLLGPKDWEEIKAAAPVKGAVPLERFRELRHRIETEI
jgi:hemerythrin-like domain-containing protein